MDRQRSEQVGGSRILGSVEEPGEEGARVGRSDSRRERERERERRGEGEVRTSRAVAVRVPRWLPILLQVPSPVPRPRYFRCFRFGTGATGVPPRAAKLQQYLCSQHDAQKAKRRTEFGDRQAASTLGASSAVNFADRRDHLPVYWVAISCDQPSRLSVPNVQAQVR